MTRTALVLEPAYVQLVNHLRERIRLEHYEVGQRFLTERHVSEEFGISRATANKALSALVAEGVLEFKKGLGTFVKAPALDLDLTRLASFHDKATALNLRPATSVTRLERLASDQVLPWTRDDLALSGSDEVIALARIRSLNGRPVIFEERWIVGRLLPDVTPKDFEGSFYGLLHGRDIEVDYCDERIRAISTDPDEADLLGASEGDAALCVRAIAYGRDAAPIWTERTLYRADAYEFRNRVGRTHGGAQGSLIQP